MILTKESVETWRLPKKILFSILVACLFLISCSNAIMFKDNFDNNVLDTSFWNTYGSGGPQIVEMNQQLEITLPSESSGDAFSAGYASKCALRGDFDIQVDYKLITWPSVNGVRIGLAVRDKTVDYALERDSWSLSDSQTNGDLYATDFAGSINFTKTTDKTGKLRLMRLGTTIYGYYLDSLTNQWILLSKSPVSDRDTTFWIAAWSHDYAFKDTTTKVAFDNFIVNRGEIICPVVQTVLLVSGSNTESAGYTNIQPSNPLALETTSYSNGGWSSAVATHTPFWYNPTKSPFGSGATWISSATMTANGSGDQWRLFKTDFDIPEGSLIYPAQLWYTADDAVAVYLNDAEIGSTGFVYGADPAVPPDIYKNSYCVNFTPRFGSNTLKFVVRNRNYSDFYPTGLLYKGIIEYESPTSNNKTLREVFLPSSGNRNQNYKTDSNLNDDFLSNPTNLVALLAFFISIVAIIISFVGFWIQRKHT